MKKIACTAAVAAALGLGLAAPAQAMDFQINEDTTFSVYGNIQYIYVNAKTDTTPSAPGGVESLSQFADNGSTFGFAGEYEWDNGLTGYFRYELDGVVADEKGSATNQLIDQQLDEAYVGVKGSFGNVRLGVWDGIYQDTISDPINPFEYIGITEANGIGEPGNSIAYYSPEFGGFSFAVQAFVLGDGEGVNLDANPDADSEIAFAATASYAVDIFTVSLGYTDQGYADDQSSNIGLTGTVDLAPFTVGARIQSNGDDDNTENGEMLYALYGSYDYGPGSVMAAVQQVSPNDDSLDSATQLLLNVNYSISDNMYVYVEGGFYDQEDDLGNYTGVGTVFLF